MKKLLVTTSVVILAACQTTGTVETQPNEIIVQTAKRSNPAQSKPATAPLPPPPPLASVMAWDGSIISHPSQAPIQPIATVPQGVILRESETSDEFEEFSPNPYKRVTDSPVSTFSSDVDTASYSIARSYLNRGQRPPEDAIRIEEILNYFDYDYDKPTSRMSPFKPNLAIVPSPWNSETKLLHIGIQGYVPPKSKRPPMNLVFLIDTSGSMNAENKLALLKKSFGVLLDQLTEEDRVSIVTYGPTMETILVPTAGDQREAIEAAIAPLVAKGGTNGQAGLQQAYRVAEQSFIKKGTNRVILATDGDFNIGISNPEELKSYVEEKRDSGVYISALGFGNGNLKDNRMQALAQNGNGTAYYIDNLREAKKVFGTDFGKSLVPIADDLKLQVEFNPNLVTEYRLLGYETRALQRQDFNNDKVDAGDIGAGHSVTAIYEILPVGAINNFVDPLRYGGEAVETLPTEFADEYGFLKLRYKRPGEASSTLISEPITRKSEYKSLRNSPKSTQWAVAVGGYALYLRGDDFTEGVKLGEISKLAKGAKGSDRFGYRSELLELLDRLSELDKE